MDIPNSESVAIVRAGLAGSPINLLPPELRLCIMQFSIESIRKAVVAPTAMTRKTTDTPALRPNEQLLVFTTTNPLANTCSQLHEEYTMALKAHVTSCKLLTLVLHVLDFDFPLITQELFHNFTAAQRQHYNTLPNSIRIEMTITDAFARLPDENRLGEWLQWRATEESAGRGFRVNYVVRLKGSTKGVNEMESIRYGLLLYDPYEKAEGEVGGIMRAVKAWFQKVANQRP
jgi:hypothetical protein